MNRDEVQRLLELARRLGSTPRRVLVEAARMVDDDAAGAAEKLQAMRLRGIHPGMQSDACASLLLTPVSGVARDAVDNALGTLWHVPGQADE
ncbi:MAG TPA: hypothetical protein PKC03_09935 [Dokdonella sp.]|nr:hypothetical protein [Dokdonella sp.]